MALAIGPIQSLSHLSLLRPSRPSYFGTYRASSSLINHVGIPFAAGVSIPCVPQWSTGSDCAVRVHAPLRLMTKGRRPSPPNVDSAVRVPFRRKGGASSLPFNRDVWPMALQPLHAPCLFQLPLLALGMASTSNTPVYTAPAPPAPQPPAAPRPPKFFPPERYIAAQAQYVFYGIVSRLPMVARVTLTDYRGRVLLDTFVRPTLPVCDYRTAETGLESHHIVEAPVFIDVQRQVASIIRDKILVGYALWEFLSVMGLAHQAINTRDTALFMSFRRTMGYRPNVQVPLVTLVKHFMCRDIEQNGDIPVERARAALDLFRSCEEIWEGVNATGVWPCALPPVEYRQCFT